MSSMDFIVIAKGTTAEKAFWAAVRKAAHDHGHSGYTGTIAEKAEFVEIELPVGEHAEGYAEELLAQDDPRINDKWGPAGCIKMSDNEFVFFGRASS